MRRLHAAVFAVSALLLCTFTTRAVAQLPNPSAAFLGAGDN